MKLRSRIDRTWIGIAVAAVAALAGPLGLAVGYHSHPVGHHSHPVPAPRFDLDKVVDQYNVRVGATNGYTVIVRNLGVIRGTLLEIVDTLPEGFQYLPGSTSGAILDDPVVQGRKLRWAGPFRLNGNTNMSFHFEVRAPQRPGRYYNVVDGRARPPFIVLGTGLTAPMLVGVRTELFARPAILEDGQTRLKFSARLTSRGRPLGGKWVDFFTSAGHSCTAPT
ncbi:MAG: DUF11 domain-containing protein, partial [Actinomycetota bacterium]